MCMHVCVYVRARVCTYAMIWILSQIAFNYTQYGRFIQYMKVKANARSSDPLRSPSAVKYGIAELSGSILYLHIAWIIMCATYNRIITWKKWSRYKFVSVI